MSPAEVFALHELNACVEGGDICNCCLENWPCHAYLVACWAEAQLSASAILVADLVQQRDQALRSQGGDV